MTPQSGTDNMLFRLVVVFLLLALCIGLAGYLYYDHQHQQIKRDIQYELSAITDLKATQINAWRRERLGDANGISQTGFVAARAQQFMNDPGAPGLKDGLLAWMRSFQDVNKYKNIILTDSRGRALLSAVEKESAAEPEEKKAVLEALRTRQSLISDIHRSDIVDYAHIDLVSPLIIRRGKTQTPVGSLVLRIDPEQFLYPIVQTWPTPDKSAETLLLRRNGNEVAVLREARHRKNAALTFQVPLSMNPALIGLLDRGQKGIIEATDYRGVRVLAAVQPLDGTPWFLASKIDQEEIYAPLRERSLLLLAVLVLLITAAGLSIVFWWRQKSAEHLRKQYEAELERKTLSQRYEYLSEDANDIILLIDPSGAIREANKRAITAYGYTHDELLRLNIRDLQSPETHTEIAAQMQQVRDRGGFLFETLHRRKNGTIFPVEVSSRYIAGDGKSYYQSIIRDITERSQAEASFRERNAFIEAVFCNLPIGLAVNNVKDGNAIFMNAQFEAIYGWPKEALTSVDEFFAHVYPDSDQRMRIKEQILSDIGSGDPSRMRWENVPITTRKGETKFITAVNIPLFEQDLMISTVFDVTMSKRAEQALTESERRYKRLIESVTDYIYTVEIEKGRAGAAYHGPGCAAVTGYTAEEYQAIPDLWIRMIHEQDRQQVLAQVEKVLAGEAVPSFEHRIIHKNGSLRWIRNTSVPRYDREGCLIAYDALITDITQIRLLENQLRQAQKMEAVGQLAGGVAHDFNNILTAIIGYANLLLRKMPESDPARAYIDHILSSSERAAHLTHSLLAFSRKQVINLKPIHVNDVIRRVEKLLTRVIGEDIDFKIRLCAADLIILADSIQIEQVLMNLATNARDAMPNGGKLLVETDLFELGEEFVRTHSYGNPGPYALVSVTDTGVGMEEEVRSRIFEPFFTTKEVGEGTGLGLAMIYGIIKQHNGYIHVSSEPGRGTTFMIYLPVIAAAAALKSEHEGGKISGGNETILLAEDDDMVRALSRSVLEDSGYKVIEAVDGEDAVRRFTENKDRVDLLVFDIVMPKKNGKEAWREIDKIRPGIKALFTSGYTADNVHNSEIMEAGMDFVVKPSTPGVFLKKVREVLDKR